tara:strand:- start:43477 stop:43998 length:522 start_codon:yes stop_codon:yes gene_type:complete
MIEKIKNNLTIIILIIVVIIIFYCVLQSQTKQLRTDGTFSSADGNGYLFYLGRGSSDDSLETLLHRTHWAAYLNKRTQKWERVFMITIVIMILLFAIQWRGFPSPTKFVTYFFIIFFVIFMMNNFFYVHGDIYNDAYIRKNILLITEKLSLNGQFQFDPPLPTSDAPDRLDVM